LVNLFQGMTTFYLLPFTFYLRSATPIFNPYSRLPAVRHFNKYSYFIFHTSYFRSVTWCPFTKCAPCIMPSSAWCILYSAWCMLYSTWCMLYSAWCMPSSTWCMLYSERCMLYFEWCMSYSGMCRMLSSLPLGISMKKPFTF